MRPDYSGRLAFIGVALPIFTVVMVMMFGSEGDPITDWLYRWSTLITGVAAVAAAVMTIRQMQQTDEAQEDRHRQLVGLSLRADQLRAERATFPAALDIRIWVDDVDRLKLRNTIEEAIGELDMNDSFEVATRAFALQNILKRRALIEATDLFGHRLFTIYEELVAKSDSVALEIADSAGGRLNFGVTDSDRELARAVLMDLVGAKPYLEELATRLIWLDQAYRDGPSLRSAD
ncbi:hypothetical protein LB523_10535 [Mesorhizobium sp. ESP-6-4]|uniref:hypothetical protein n=1 Tax=Mesorhizobium sp. ESP-6-4 TaxID=2876624 RepID=UPI001CCE3F60|nr:hypothetical protein [Mesorhizobium sp. ESP-6-4]MBZ9659482.1 hypothetical protein [Mesorhizobium sp. ESP-6-4]